MKRPADILTHRDLFLPLLLWALLLSAVATVSAQNSSGPRVVYSRVAERLFAKGLERYEDTEFAKARDSFQELSGMRANQRTSAGLLMLSATQVKLGEYRLALEAARRVERDYQSSRYVADARLIAGDCYYFMRRYYEAASQYGRILATPAPLPLQASAAERLVGIVKNRSITADAFDLIRPQVGEDRLRDALLFGEARWYRRLGWEQQARAAARTYLAELPDGIFSGLAARSLREPEAIRARETSIRTAVRADTPDDRVSTASASEGSPTISKGTISRDSKPRLGVLLPLSGPEGHYGQELLSGIRLANEEAGYPFDLVEADTGREYPWIDTYLGREQVHIEQSEGSKLLRTVQAARYLIEEQEVIALIGPLFSSSCVVAASVAEDAGVPLIAPLTQQSGLDSLGQFIFQLNIVAEVQGKALAEYATLVLGLETLAVLSPLTDYGLSFSLAFADAVEDNGGTVVHSDWYVPEETRDFKNQFQAMRQAGFRLDPDPEVTPAVFDSLSMVVLDSSPESEGTFYELLETGEEVSPEDQPDSTEIFIDAIEGIAVVVESFEDAKRIAAQLRFHRLRTQVLGNDIWYDPDGIRQMTAPDREYVKGCILVSGRGQGATAERDFTDRFRRRFGRDPGYAGFGYDAAAIVAAGWLEGNESRGAMRDWLAALTDYDGVSGRISFPPGRRANDELNLVKIDSRGRLVPLAVGDLPDIAVPEDDLPVPDMMEDYDGTGSGDRLPE